MSNTHNNFNRSSSDGGRGISVGPAALSGASNFNAGTVKMMIPRATMTKEAAKSSGVCDPVMSGTTVLQEEGKTSPCEERQLLPPRKSLSRAAKSPSGSLSHTSASPTHTKLPTPVKELEARGNTEGVDSNEEKRAPRERRPPSMLQYDRLAEPSEQR